MALRSPGVTFSIIAMLSLGTGGVITVFTPVYSLISAPTHFSQQEQLVRIGGNIPIFNIYFSRFERREELGNIFSNLTAYAPTVAFSLHIPETGKYKQNVRGVRCDLSFTRR